MKRLPSTIFLHVTTACAACVFALPFVWLVRRAAADNWMPLRQLLAQQPVWTWLLNSTFLASAYTALIVLICGLSAFALAKYSFPGRRLLVAIMLLTVLIPPQVLLPAGFELVVWLGWANTFTAALVPGLANVFAVLLLMQAMKRVPDETLNAARLDGCSELRVWWSIAMPLARPMIGAISLMSFLGSWNSFLWPQVVLIDATKHTLPIGLANLSGLPQASGVMYAAVLIGVIPAAVVFAMFQRDFAEGVATGGEH